MSSTIPVMSLMGLQKFTLFSRLPLEIRCVIWQASLPSRIVELFVCGDRAGFFSPAKLPVALQVCRDSRDAVGVLYPTCFGSFLQPEKVRFNFDLDVLYIDLRLEEDDIYHLLGILTKAELAQLKYVAIDQEYFGGGSAIYDSSTAGLKRALNAMKSLREILVVYDITDNDSSNLGGLNQNQMKIFPEKKGGEMEEGWPADVGDLPCVQEYEDWKPFKNLKMTPVYGWRGLT